MKKISLLTASLVSFSLLNATESLTEALQERALAFQGSKSLYSSKIFLYIGAKFTNFYGNTLKDLGEETIQRMLETFDKAADVIIQEELTEANRLSYGADPIFSLNVPKTINVYRALTVKLEKEIEPIDSKLSRQAALLEEKNTHYFMALHATDIVS